MSGFDRKLALEFCDEFFAECRAALEKVDKVELATVAGLLYEAKCAGQTIFFFGNGGSQSIANHLACDFGKGTKLAAFSGQKVYRCMSLDSNAWLTAQANDGAAYFKERGLPGNYEHGYDGAFVGQMENFIREGDVAFAISSSGNSPNVLNALEFAKSKGARTIAMVGFDGGRAAAIAEHVILVPTQKGQYGVVEGTHSLIHHYLYELARRFESRDCMAATTGEKK